jgi:hypothetical protein
MNEWWEGMKMRVKNIKPLADMISADAHRRRNPGVRPAKAYALYDPFGNTGKSYLMYCLASIYSGRANVEVKTEQIENDRFNDWMSALKMVNIDEPPNGNYKNHKIEAFLKLCTNYTMSCRGMQKEAKVKPIDFITSFASNQPDLYGVVRAEPAVLSRLCIIEFHECKDHDALYRWTHDKFNPETPEFRYSFDQWLLNGFVIPSDFSLDRYQSQEKDEFIARSKQTKRNSIEQWLTSEFEVPNDENYGSFKNKTFKKVEYATILESTANQSYRDFMRGRDKIFGEDGLIKTLLALGFEQYKYSGTRYLRMERTKFDALREQYNDHIQEIAPDGEDDA